MKERERERARAREREQDAVDIGRKTPAELSMQQAGLEWMLRAPTTTYGTGTAAEQVDSSASLADNQIPASNSRELNPYLKNGGSGYASDDGEVGLQNIRGSGLPKPSIFGDGGASWRLKALKRAKEQAEREGRKLDEVLEERWGSLGEMTSSLSVKRAAHANAHLHAIRDRKHNLRGFMDQGQGKMENASAVTIGQGESESQNPIAETVRKSSTGYRRASKMKTPRENASLSWTRDKCCKMRDKDVEIVQATSTDSSLNKFTNDGSFLKKFKDNYAGLDMNEKDEHGLNSRDLDVGLVGPTSWHDCEKEASESCKLTQDVTEDKLIKTDKSIDFPKFPKIQGMSMNQLAAKAIQLRMRGKLVEADELLKQVEIMNQGDNIFKQNASQGQLQDTCNRLVEGPPRGVSVTLKSIVAEHEIRNQRNDGDTQMAVKILQNKQYTASTSLDDEYEHGSELTNSDKRKNRPSRKKHESESSKAVLEYNRIVTQNERCQFCFDNPTRSKHLTLSIANSTYLMLPPKEPLVEGHCYILPLLHEGSTRSLDENVWEELRNYKKCLFKMFAQQDRSVIFIETAIHLAQQRRHCLVECIPLPHDVTEQAPLYFKKAIDEAEDEWSQHHAKRLIDTSKKGLRGSIPKNFPYFHVEFGMRSGFVHVIDDERNFKSHFGHDVVIGMLTLSEERMYRPQKKVSYESQKTAVTEFQKMWDPFDWTKMLD